jgi:phage-related minor tail protein
MEDTREEKLDYIEGQLLLLDQEIAELMSEEEKDMENLKDENRIAIIKERLEKYDEIFMFLDEAEGIIAELREQI